MLISFVEDVTKLRNVIAQPVYCTIQFLSHSEQSFSTQDVMYKLHTDIEPIETEAIRGSVTIAV